MAFVAIIGLYPTPVDRGIDGLLFRVLRALARHDLGFITYARVEFSANVLFFVPVGLLLALLFGARWWWAIILCVALSSMIELSQLLFLPHRYASFGDILANSLGGTIGAVLALLLLLPRWAAK
ncbi:MAG: VanZ family protein [Lacisediminihabitans sp.]